MKGPQGKRIFLLGLLLVFLSPPHSHGVLFVSTGDPSFNTTAPTGSLTDSGWQYEGQWGEFLGTPISSNLFLAAKHVNGSVGQTFVLNGATYHTVAFFDEPSTDLRIWQVAETFPAYAPLYTKTDEVGKRFVVFGRGTDRGPAVVVNGITKGWQWGATNNIERWGGNVVANVSTNGNMGPLLIGDFNKGGPPSECGLSYDDSSGGMFIEDGATWKLAGINYSVSGPFSLDGTVDTQFDAALTDARGLYYLSSTNGGVDTWTPIPANYPVALPSSFGMSRVSANISWITSILNYVPPGELQITSPPTTTNALAIIGDTALVRPGDTVGFSVTSLSTNGYPTSCAWTFDDGGDSTECTPSHVFTNCGAYAVSVTVTDGVASVTTGLTVAVVCPMGINSVRLQANFNRSGSDSCAVSGTLSNLPSGFSFTNAAATLDVGGATVTIPLTPRGSGASRNGSIRFSYNKNTAVWTFTSNLKGNLHDAWAAYGVTNAITIDSQVTLPVLLLIEADIPASFEADPLLGYSNRSGASGTATYPPPR
jgi:hypothetical protein